jgi:hypothetical protein
MVIRRHKTVRKRREITVSHHETVRNRHEITVKRHETVRKRRENTVSRHETVRKRHEITGSRHEMIRKRREITVKRRLLVNKTVKNHDFNDVFTAERAVTIKLNGQKEPIRRSCGLRRFQLLPFGQHPLNPA